MLTTTPFQPQLSGGDNSNFNLVILGRSGSGKTEMVKQQILDCLPRGLSYYVVDPEGEFTELARALGGRVWTLRAATPDSPFGAAALSTVVNDFRVRAHTILDQGLSAELLKALDQALIASLTEVGINPKVHDFDGKLGERNHADLNAFLAHSTNDNSPIGRPLGTDPVPSDNQPLTIFDVSGLDPQARPAAAVLCCERVWCRAPTEPNRTVLVIEEVSSLLKTKDGARCVVSMVKRSRKYQLALILTTQDVNEFITAESPNPGLPPPGPVILQNATHTLLSPQLPEAASALNVALHLGQEAAEWLTSCPQGSGVLVSQGVVTPITFDIDREPAGPTVHGAGHSADGEHLGESK